MVYRSCYAPVDLHLMLSNAERRSRIRRLPPAHLFFGLKELEDEDIVRLLPHVTEEQWRGVLDLDLWSRDRASVEQFLYWERFVVDAGPAVARKLIRAADPELWELTFKRQTKVYSKLEDDYETGAEQEEGEPLHTPDGNYLVILPKTPELARTIRALILKLYELDPGWVALALEGSRYRTSIEIEEAAYQNRTRRIEELGFQDYYDAIEIYSHLAPGDTLPEKTIQRSSEEEVSIMPVLLQRQSKDTMLIFQALAGLTGNHEVQTTVEELFFVCNKVLSADRVSPAEPAQVKRGIRKAIAGMNLGLDVWSEGNLGKAMEGLRSRYLVSFFQLGFNRLRQLQKQARKLKHLPNQAEPGSFLEAAVNALARRYPLLAFQDEGKIRKRFLTTREDLKTAEEYLKQATVPDADTRE